MPYINPETNRVRAETALAWSAFTAGLGLAAYLELINHRLIGSGGLRALVAHSTLFASLTVCLLGAAPGIGAGAICASIALMAVGAEFFEIIPTSVGTLANGLASIFGVAATWAGARYLGRPRSDTAMALAIVLWAVSLGCAVITLSDSGMRDDAADASLSNTRGPSI